MIVHILSRSDWRNAYRQLRIDARENFMRGKNVTLRQIMHGGTYWTIARDMVARPYAETRVYPSIIRDRATISRVTHELTWAAVYRRGIGKSRAFYGNGGRLREISAARACVADARSIRLDSSAFHSIAA